ncbi:MAG: collagen binding domain-containing protein [Gemmiger sp.]|nr:collagen binding domain-containing protein [Gemmiger sp.]MDY5783353.1 collagen binding domain-containing protein [Gemmiger sp.]
MAVALLSDEEEAGQSDTARADLTSYIGSDTNFRAAKYNPTTNQVEVSFHTTFGMSKSDIQSADYLFAYTLPKGLIIPDDMLGKTYEGRDTSGAKGFTYQFVKNDDETYSILVDFDQTYVDSHDNFSGYIDFSAYAGEDAWKEGGGYEFKFNDNCTVTIPVSKIEQEEDESIHYNIAVSKSNSGYDAATNKITYTVTVDTTKGTPDPLNLTDILTAQGLEVDKVEIGSVTRINDRDQWGNPIYNNGVADQTTLTKGNSATGDQYTFSYDSTNGIQMNLPGLKKGTSGNGQKYTITYDVYLKEPAAGASYTVGNKATVTGTDNSKGETVTDSAETSTTIDKSLTLQKYGTYVKATDKIKWTITVNENGNDIAGATLTDSMFTGQTVTVSPNSGCTLNGDTITFSVVDGDTNTQTYTITYETDAPEVGEGGTVTVENKATVTPPGGGTSVEVKAPVTIDKNMKMVKTGTYDKATDTITWTITVNENGNDIAGAELTDTMFSSVQADSITVSPSRDGMTITQNSDGTIQKITFGALEGGTTNTQTYTITYTTPSGIGANASGTVTNTATFDSKPGEEGGEITSGPGVWVDRTVDLDKSGGWYDSSTNRIYWKIDVNTKGNNINDYTLTDNMLAQAVDGTLTIKLDGWNSVDVNSTDNGFTIKKDTDGKITSITFTAIGDTGANTNHYTIEYYTEAKPGWNSTTVTNTATLTPPGGTPITDEQTSSIPADGSVCKKCQGATAPVSDGNSSNITITWRTEINVPADGLPAGTVVTDTLADGQWMDWLQIQKWGSVLFAKQTAGEDYLQDINYWWPQGETYDITFYDTEGTSYPYADIVSNNGVQGKKFVKYEIKFPNGVPADIYGGKIIFFEYESYADVSGVTDEATYKNTVSVTPPDSTPKSSEATYTYKAPGVVKMDGDGKTGTSSIVTTNGELTWKVRVRLDADCTTLTLTDNLPEGVTLTGLTFANQALTIGEDGSITGTLEGLTVSNGSVTAGDDGKQTLNLTVTVPEGGTTPGYLKANGEFYVVYTCKISDELLEKAQNAEDHKVGTFTNSVTVTADSKAFPPAEQTQDVTYTKPTSGLKLVNKDGVWVNDSRLLEYSMLLNPDSMDLLPNSDTLTLTDELSYYVGNASEKFDVSLLPGSVVLYRAVQNEDGTWSRGEPVTDWSWSVATRTEHGTQFYSTITATIPDGTPLILEYAYTVWVPEGSSFDNGSSTYYGMYNKATLSGISGGSDKTQFNVEWKDSETSAGITADRAYIFYKVEENSYGNRLPGAEFTLYDSTGNELFTYTTDSNGSFVVQWQSEGNGGYQSFAHNTLYYVQETKAPEGYQLPDEPTKYYFYFSDATDTEHTLDTSMIPENAVDLSVTAYTAYVENTKNTTQITVNKKWFKSDGTNDITSTKAGSISFDLYRIASTTPPSGSGGGSESGGGTGVSYKYTSNGSTEVKSGTLSGIQVGSVVEITVTMTYDCTYWQPTVTLTGMEAVNEGTWTHGSNSVYTRQATVTEQSIVVDVGDSVEKFSVSITKISDPETTDPDEPPSAEPAGTLYSTYTITKDGGWTWIKDDLLLTGKDEAGNTLYYTYYVVEHSGANYSTSYDNNGGIASGTITIKNTESDTPVYTLPETGGGGTTPYTVGGLALMAGAGLLLLYNHSKRRKEDLESS